MLKSITFNLMLLIALVGFFQCTQSNNTISKNLQGEIPPDDLYLIDKIGLPTEEFLQLREKEIANYKKQFRLNKY